jgi:polyhydroxyalkanoate synthesis regulator phasin
MDDLDQIFMADQKEAMGLGTRFTLIEPVAAPMEPEPDPLDVSMVGVETAPETSVGDFLAGVADTWGSMLRGSVAGAVGAPGDIEALGSGIKEIFIREGGEGAWEAFQRGFGQETILPTTEEISAALPEMTQMSEMSAEDMKTAQGMGEFLPVGVGGAVGAKKVAEKLGKKPSIDTPEDLMPLQIDEAAGQQIDVPVVQTQRPLEKASEQFKAGLISGEEAVAAMDDVIRRREMAASARAWNQAQKGRARGARFVRSKIDDAVRKGEVDPDAADVALWALNKNPSIADDLGISITKRPEGSMTAGAYNSAGRIVKLFKGQGNPTTAIHEVLHHSEKMLPPSLRNPIADLWKKRLSAAVNEARKSGDLERAELLLKQAAVRRGDAVDPELQQEIMEAYASGKLNKTRDYQFTNPSEFWAENAANIISGKFGNQGKWVAQAKDYMNELLEHVKAKLGLDSNDALYKGIKQVLSGQQLEKGTMVAESEKGLSAVQQFLQDPSMVGTVPDLMKVQEQILRGAK